MPPLTTCADLMGSVCEKLARPPAAIYGVMRHSSWETTRKHYAPGDIKKDAAVLQSLPGSRPTYEKNKAS